MGVQGLAFDPTSLAGTAHRTDLQSAAREFEGFLVGVLLSHEPMVKDGLLGGGSAGRMYQELFYQEIARISAAGNGFGIAQLIVSQSRVSQPEETP